MIMLALQTKTGRTNQQGFASMVIALILVLVLALMTIGFAQVARREQQSTLAKQLANQANYAAESAINDAIVDIKNGKINQGNAGGGTTCVHPGGSALTNNANVEPAFGVSYSCLLVNLQPPNLIKQPLDPDNSWTIAFNTSLPLSSLTIRWSSTKPGRVPQGPRVSRGFMPTAVWNLFNSPGVLQASLTPLSTLGITSRDTLINNTFTAFLYPSNEAASSTNYAPSSSNSNAPLISGNCPVGNPGGTFCVSTINNIPLLAPTDAYLLRIYDYYDASNITVTGTTIAGLPVNFINGQAQVDATGKAKNVLKRLQARVPLNGLNTTLPSFAIEAQDICKREQTGPTTVVQEPDGSIVTNNPNGTDFIIADSTATATAGTNDPCYLSE